MKTSIPRNSPPSYYIDGMDLGKGVDAITGDITKSALDPTFTKEDVESTDSSDSFTFDKMEDATKLQDSQAVGFSGSITFPVDGVAVGAKRTLDFSNSDESSTSVLLIMLDWERRGSAKRVGSAKLSSQAESSLQSSEEEFRNKYGDFFVYQILSIAKFTVVWKCTTENTSHMKSFSQEISASLSASEISAEGSFTTKFNSIADRNHIKWNVKWQAVGNSGNTQYEHEDVLETFKNFRNVVKPVPYQVLLHHYSTIDGNVPTTINMDPDVYARVGKVFMLARFLVLLIGIVPGTRSVRMDRQQKIATLFSEIYAKRVAYERDPDALRSSLEELNAMHQLLELRLQRQDLVIEMHSITYDDMKKKFSIVDENVRGAWIESSEDGSADGSASTYVLGRTGFSDTEITKYGIKEKRNVYEVHLSGVPLDQQVAALEFPGATGINGYVVGLTIESCWKDGSNGYWCIGNELSLGTKQAKVEVKTRGSRGMHWKLHAHYIPAMEYDE